MISTCTILFVFFKMGNYRILTIIFHIFLATDASVADQQRIFPRNVDQENCGGGPGVVCSYSPWTIAEFDKDFVLYPDEIILDYCNVILVAYVNIDNETLSFTPYGKYDETAYKELIARKNENVKIILEIDPLMYYDEISGLLTSEENIETFVSQAMQYLREFKFDGLKLPVIIPWNTVNQPANYADIKKGYARLTQRLKYEMSNYNLILCMGLPYQPEYITSGYELSELNKYVEFYSVDSLSYHYPREGHLLHSTPLYAQKLDDVSYIDYTMLYLITIFQIPANKLVLEIPLFAHTSELENPLNIHLMDRVSDGPIGPVSTVEGIILYSELCNVKDAKWLTPAILVDYDNPFEIVAKVTYAKSRHLGGVNLQSISMDDATGELCGMGPMPFTRAVSWAFNSSRPIFQQGAAYPPISDFIDPDETNKLIF